MRLELVFGLKLYEITPKSHYIKVEQKEPLRSL